MRSLDSPQVSGESPHRKGKPRTAAGNLAAARGGGGRAAYWKPLFLFFNTPPTNPRFYQSSRGGRLCRCLANRLVADFKRKDFSKAALGECPV